MHMQHLPRTRPARVLPPLLAAALLAGCSFIPKYERPAAPVPQAFALAGSNQPAPAKAAADIDWKD